MGVLLTIERLRRYPERTRERIALSVAAGVTAVIAILWLSTFSAARDVINRGEVSYSSEEISEPAGPLEVLGGVFYEGYEQFREFGQFFGGFK